MSLAGAKPTRCPSVESFCEVAVLIRFSRLSVTAAIALFGAALPALAPPVVAQVPASTATAVPAAGPAGAPTPIPVLAAPTDVPTALPSGAATPQPRRRRGRHDATGSASPAPPPAPTPTPTVPGFATLDGTWEVQLQKPDSTDYSYLEIKQAGTTLSGSWRVKKQTYPFTDATYDGKLVRIVVTTPAGAETFSGYVENGSDMVGTLDAGDKKDPLPFTAGHRGKDKGLFGPGISPAGIPLPGSGGSSGAGGGNFPH